MANLINAPKYVIRNQPIEIATDTSDDMRLLISNVSSPNNNIYEGIVNPSPNNNRVGLDIRPYVYDEVSFEDFTFNTPFNKNSINSAAQYLYIRMLTMGGATSFSQTSTAFAINSRPHLLYRRMSYDDYQRMTDGLPFGKYKEWVDSGGLDFNAISGGRLLDDFFINNYVCTFGKRTNKILGNAPFFISTQLIAKNVLPMEFYYSETDSNWDAQSHTQLYDGNYNEYGVPTLWTNAGVNDEYFRISIQYLSNNDYNRIIHFQRVNPSCFKNEPYQLYWINNRGGLDWIILSGKSVVTKQSKSKSYETTFRTFDNTSFSGDLTKQINKKYNVESFKEYSLNSEFMKEEDFKWLDDIIDSEYVWLYNPKDESIKAVDVLDTDFTYKHFRNDKMFRFEINLRDQHKE